MLQVDPLAKYVVAFPGTSRSIFTRANPGPQSAHLHLPGTHRGLAVSTLELALPVRLDPVEQRLIDQTHGSRRRCNALARAFVVFVIDVLLPALKHSARDTFFASKVMPFNWQPPWN